MNEIKIIQINDIYTLDFEITSFFAQRQKWIDGILFKREKMRESSALIYLNGCTGIYTDLISGENFFAPCKSFVYLPYGGRYTVLNIESQKSKPDAYLVEFNMKYKNELFALSSKPFLIQNINSYYIEKLMRETVDCYESVPKSIPFLKSKIYEFLAIISNAEKYDNNKKYKSIQPALDYINKNPFDWVSIEEYAKMCNLSCGGFRRIFKQYIGISPREFLINLIINAAKKLLEESDMSIKSIAETLHFESTEYFCRLFKLKTKLSPTEYRIQKK